MPGDTPHRLRYGLTALAGGWLLATAAAAGAPPGAVRAPALTGREWINSRPLTPVDLKDKVVVVEFWTFDCINCRRTVPAMNRLHATFRDSGDVVIVGVHTPELPRERDPRAVERAVAAQGITFPVLLDGGMANWKAFGNHYWPAIYVIDRRGRIRDLHTGELHPGTPAWDSLLTLIGRLRRERG